MPPADTAPTAGKTTAAKAHAANNTTAGQRAKAKSVTSDKTAAVKVGKSPITSSHRQGENTPLAHNLATGKGLKKPMDAIAAARKPGLRPWRQTRNHGA